MHGIASGATHSVGNGASREALCVHGRAGTPTTILLYGGVIVGQFLAHTAVLEGPWTCRVDWLGPLGGSPGLSTLCKLGLLPSNA